MGPEGLELGVVGKGPNPGQGIPRQLTWQGSPGAYLQPVPGLL